ncbi:MAG TPA: DNA polymerase III subunit beta [Candidatus Anaerotruncus excrementipullorum]|uniref:Beta sliding clamp n=1 Tax=Candidatus Anaerotruncus excrementipullorum TaxID=2838465 RepID=A0A9D1WPX9_9FIRM|nr:DNA polymerase III subunit beta [Candidatus Anaerotruncus excrementipullorum]
MNLLCDRQTLVEAVANVSRAVSTKSTLAALEGVLMKAENGCLSLTGYDLELAISTTIEARVLEPGTIVLPAKIFFDMVRRMPSDQVSIQSDDKLLTLVKGGMTQYTILGIPALEYPELPTVAQTYRFQLPQAVLKEMISQTQFAIATNDTKPVHMGSMFDLDNGTLNLVSVDGYRLALRREQVDCDKEEGFVVPGKSLAEVAKLLKDSDEPATLAVARRHVIFEVEGYTVISRLLEGEFLDWRSAIPQGAQTTLRVSVRGLVNAIERASLLISDSVKSPLRMKLEGGLMQITCSSPLGRAYDELTCQQQGEGLEIGFNSRYMLDALKASGCDELQLLFNGPLSPIKLLPLEGEAFTFLVLPVRLKSGD